MSDLENTLKLTLESGEVTIALKPDLAPKHVARIKELAREGFYDGLNFHRVIDGFVAQGGCPEGTGTGGTGQKIPAEFNEGKHVRGTCSMARSQNPDSGDCQFYICLDDVSYLDGQYTVWGEVTSGMENVDALPKGEPPRTPGKIISMKVAADI
ncbi:MAG: peptidylprolyl isomerase [Hirschia sp.]|nr:peptidylprolyl isomerase [Hirschia sp.]MBF19933.1 peptidylprolyl isomerase [Hirschia sp.]|tara:strand:+ start:420 stop:881 length:462 start_codon:yes stop_codon:yes gene_type:complete